MTSFTSMKNQVCDFAMHAWLLNEAVSESSDGTDCLHYHSSCLIPISDTEAVLLSDGDNVLH